MPRGVSPGIARRMFLLPDFLRLLFFFFVHHALGHTKLFTTTNVRRPARLCMRIRIVYAEKTLLSKRVVEK
jgi:hypothetical protein